MGALPMRFGRARPHPKSLFPWEEEEALSVTLAPGELSGKSALESRYAEAADGLHAIGNP